MTPASGKPALLFLTLFRLFDLRAGDNIHVLCDSKSYDPVKDFAFSKSGRLIFAATKSDDIKIWDTLETKGAVLSKVGMDGEGGIIGLSLSADGGDIAAASFDGTIAVLSKNLDDI